MAGDVARLMDHLSIERADIMGYSMGSRIATYFALANPQRTRSLLLGGVGVSLIERDAMAPGMAEAMEIERIEDIDDPGLKIFRGFAESTRSDLRALAACARGCGRGLDPAALSKITAPTLVCVGTRDDVAATRIHSRRLSRMCVLSTFPGATTTAPSAIGFTNRPCWNFWRRAPN